jgi:hypothetical protein
MWYVSDIWIAEHVVNRVRGLHLAHLSETMTYLIARSSLKDAQPSLAQLRKPYGPLADFPFPLFIVYLDYGLFKHRKSSNLPS